MSNRSFTRFRVVKGTIIAGCIGLMISFHLVSLAQSPTEEKHSDQATETQANLIPLNLRYDEPQTYSAGGRNSLVISDFKCGSEGSVFVQTMDGAVTNEDDRGGPPVDHSHGVQLNALTPSGDVVRFAYDNVPGLRRFLSTARYFVSPTRVYTLERADTYDSADPKKTTGYAYLILIYDYKGVYQGVIRLEPGLDPQNVAAFPSGDVLVASLDKLNQTTRFLIFDSAGRPVKELRVFDNDYVKKLQLADKAERADSTSEQVPAAMLMARGHWVSFGDHLLMVPTLTRLPLIELNESGVVRTTAAALPEGAKIVTLVGSSDKIYHVLVGGQRMTDSAGSSAGGASANAGNGVIPHEIDDVYPGDGTVLKRIESAHGLAPVCVQGGIYTFVAPREEDGKLRVIRGRVIY